MEKHNIVSEVMREKYILKAETAGAITAAATLDL